jgi:selenocysteine lyase/cysteine desulfurase
LNLKSNGVEIDFIPSQSNHEIDLETISAKLTPKTKLLSISFVQYTTGYRLDLAALAELCHQKNVLLSIDAIQGIGAMPIDFNKSKIDSLAAGLHKWGMSPMGTAIAVFSDELLSRLSPTFVGWLSVNDSWDMLNFDQPLKDSAQRYELGTYNWLGLIGTREAFKIFHEIGIEAISEKLLYLNSYLSERLIDLGLKPCLTCNNKNRSGIISIQQIHKPELVVKSLAEKRIEVSSRDGLLRIAPHYYCNTDEMDELISQIQQIAQ